MAEDKNRPGESAPEISKKYGEVLAEWDFYSHDEHERGRWWYILAAIIVILLLGYSFFDQNYLLAVIVALTILIFVVSEMRGPGFHNFAITEDGLIAGPDFYAYTELNNFFIIYEPPVVKTLYFDPKSVFSPHIGVPLGDVNPNEIREILLNFLPEDLEKEEEPTSDFFGRLFKF